jgi:hypothetical protein
LLLRHWLHTFCLLLLKDCFTHYCIAVCIERAKLNLKYLPHLNPYFI